MFEVTFYHNACVGIRTDDLAILCDPWLTDGAFYGSWYIYPPVPDPVELVGQWDYIWISHVHPDHYDPKFLRNYLAMYPETEIFCGSVQGGKMLSHRMTLDKIPHHSTDVIYAGDTIAIIYPDVTRLNAIDTGLIVYQGEKSVINSCDFEWNPELYKELRSLVPNGQPTVALVSYGPAGSRPQSFIGINENTMRLLAAHKKMTFLQHYSTKAHCLNAAVTIPFASNYLLGGRLWDRNMARGATDPTEILSWDDNAVILDREGVYDLEEMRAYGKRTVPYDVETMLRYSKALRDVPMDYDDRWYPEELPLDLVQRAYLRAKKFRPKDYDWWMLFPYGEDWMVVCNVNSDVGLEGCQIRPSSEIRENIEGYFPTTYIEVPQALLFGVLKGEYHWNNVEVGSHWKIVVDAPPEIGDKSPEDWLYFFQEEPS